MGTGAADPAVTEEAVIMIAELFGEESSERRRRRKRIKRRKGLHRDVGGVGLSV